MQPNGSRILEISFIFPHKIQPPLLLSRELKRLWRLKIGDYGIKNDPYIFRTKNFAGRQIWEFDPDAVSVEELAEVEEARLNYFKNRFNVKNSCDLLWQIQVFYLMHNYNEKMIHLNYT
ncbi:hypothetical protein WN943_023006 [Citrus x changshan-huyou]